MGSLALWLDQADRDEMRVGPVIFIIGPQLILDTLDHLGTVRELDRAESIHPRKGEPDRMIAATLELDPNRIRELIRQVKNNQATPSGP